MGFSDGSMVKKPPAKQETPVQSLRSSPGEENGNPLQYSCLINPMDRGAWLSSMGVPKKSRHDLATKTTNLKI